MESKLTREKITPVKAAALLALPGEGIEEALERVEKSRPMLKALLIVPNKPPIVVEMDWSLEHLQAAVGGYIELVHLGNCQMCVNEDGIAAELTPNPLADRFARARLARSGRILMGQVLGVAVLLGIPDRDGNPTSIPDDLLDRVLHYA